jgi:hypothetical protein
MLCDMVLGGPSTVPTVDSTATMMICDHSLHQCLVKESFVAAERYLTLRQKNLSSVPPHILCHTSWTFFRRCDTLLHQAFV